MCSAFYFPPMSDLTEGLRNTVGIQAGPRLAIREMREKCRISAPVVDAATARRGTAPARALLAESPTQSAH